MSEVIYIASCWLLCGVLILALMHKITEWPRYRAALMAYRLVPDGAATAVAGCLLLTELSTALLLLLLQPVGLVLVGFLLLIYAAAIEINLLRGRHDIDCGCGDEPTPLSSTLVMRNLVLAGLATWQATTGLNASLVLANATGSSWLIAICSTLLGLGIYASVNQLLANHGRYKRLWLGASYE